MCDQQSEKAEEQLTAVRRKGHYRTAIVSLVSTRLRLFFSCESLQSHLTPLLPFFQIRPSIANESKTQHWKVKPVRAAAVTDNA